VSKFELRDVLEFSEEWKNTKNSILFTSSPLFTDVEKEK
jgi:hypothetical protein